MYINVESCFAARRQNTVTDYLINKQLHYVSLFRELPHFSKPLNMLSGFETVHGEIPYQKLSTDRIALSILWHRSNHGNLATHFLYMEREMFPYLKREHKTLNSESLTNVWDIGPALFISTLTTRNYDWRNDPSVKLFWQNVVQEICLVTTILDMFDGKAMITIQRWWLWWWRLPTFCRYLIGIYELDLDAGNMNFLKKTKMKSMKSIDVSKEILLLINMIKLTWKRLWLRH